MLAHGDGHFVYITQRAKFYALEMWFLLSFHKALYFTEVQTAAKQCLFFEMLRNLTQIRWTLWLSMSNGNSTGSFISKSLICQSNPYLLINLTYLSGVGARVEVFLHEESGITLVVCTQQVVGRLHTGRMHREETRKQRVKGKDI